MSQDNNNLTVLVKQTDGSFKRVPLSQLKKNTEAGSEFVEENFTANEPKITEEKQDNIDLNSVPSTRQSPSNDNKVTTQKVSTDRSKNFGFDDKEEIIDDKKSEDNSTKDRSIIFDNELILTEEPRPAKEVKIVNKEQPEKIKQRQENLPRVTEQKTASTLPPQKVINQNIGFKHKKFNEKPQIKLSSEDFKSPLEEPFSEIRSEGKCLLSNTRLDQVQSVINNLSFKIKPDLENRLRGAIQLYLKEVRGKDNTMDLLLRAPNNGGLGLNKKQAEEILISTNKSFQVKRNKFEEHTEDNLPMINKEDLPDVYHKPGTLSKSTPFNSFIHEKEVVISKPVIKHERQKNNIELSSLPQIKPPMHDVIGKPKVYGPLEEIQNFSLIDLRRLSSNTEEAVSRFQQKFINLKEESIILFLKAYKAWVVSPLYKAYINKLSESLIKGVSLKTSSTVGDDINLFEIEALIKMNQTLEI